MSGYAPGLLVVLAVTAVLLWPSRLPARRPPGTHQPSERKVVLSLKGLLRPRGDAVAAEGDALAELLELMVPALRAGATEAAAVEMAAGAVGPGALGPGAFGALVDELGRAARSGGSVATVWARTAVAGSSAEVGFVARAWSLSEEAGVPLSVGLGVASRSLRARQAAARALTAATAGARASMVLLALLPASGPVIGLLFGLGPADLYGTAAGSLCATSGVVLAGAGWLWSRAILRRALRPSTVGDGP
jgi:tight adherence protein B